MFLSRVTACVNLHLAKSVLNYAMIHMYSGKDVESVTRRKRIKLNEYFLHVLIKSRKILN